MLKRQETGREVAVRSIQSAVTSRFKQIEHVLPANMNASRFCRIAVNQITKNPKLANCTPTSFALAVMGAAEAGLEFSLGQAYIIPYGSVATLQIGYQGMIDLAYRSGRVSNITAEVVREGDEFEYGLGTEQFIKHKRNSKVGDKLLAAYATALVAGAVIPVFIVLDADEINERRAVSKTASSRGSVWDQWPEEQWKKTAIRALFKRLPKSTEMNLAVLHDTTSATGMAVTPQTFEPSDLVLDDDPIEAEFADETPATKEKLV